MNRSNRLSNVTLAQNAWGGDVRGCSKPSDEGFSSPSLGCGYQPQHIKAKVHSEGWDV